MKKINISNEKIKYVAIGDSISEGYNARYNFGYAGYLDEKNNTISGTSWPSFLARYIKSIDKSLLKSFENFALSGTRPEDWIYFLGKNNEKYNYKNSQKKVEYIKWICDSKNNPERRKLKNKFKDFGIKEKSDFDYLIQCIKEANLITINIGANQVIPKIPIDKVASSLINNRKSKTNIIREIKKIFKNLEIDLTILFKQLKNLNPKAHIYVIGYPAMYSCFWEIINDFFSNQGFHKKLVNFCIDELNNCIKLCALKEKLNYISVDNTEFWSDNIYKLSNVFYEIHPTIFGYKKMAQDILAKICLPKKLMSDKKFVIKNIPTFNGPYWQKDRECFEQGISFTKTKYSWRKILEIIYGSKNENLFTYTKIEKSSKFLEGSLFFEQSLEPKNDPNLSINLSLTKTFLILLSNSNIHNDKLNKDIENFFKTSILNEFALKTLWLSKFANNVQNKIDYYYLTNEKMSKNYFFDLVFNEFFEKNFLLWTVKEFTKFWDDDSRKIKFIENKQTFLKVLTNLLKKDHIKLLIQSINTRVFKNWFNSKFEISIDNENVSRILDEVSKYINFAQLIDLVIDIYFSCIEQIKKTKTFDELVLLFLENEKMKELVFKNIINILNNFKIGENSAQYLMKLLHIPVFRNNLSIMTMFFNNILSLIAKTKLNYEMLIQVLIMIINIGSKKLSLQNIIDFLLSLEKNKFWNSFERIKKNEVVSSKAFLENFVKATELIFINLSIDDVIIKNIMQLSNPANLINKSTKKINIVSFFKYLDRLSKTLKPTKSLFSSLIDNYYVSPLKTKDNLYRKTYFRLMLLMILILSQMFQKNLVKNIYMGGKLSIVKLSFQIGGFKFGKNKGIDNFILDIFNEQKNYDLSFKTNIDDKKRILKVIYSFIKNENEKNYKDDQNAKIIFNALKNGNLNEDE